MAIEIDIQERQIENETGSGFQRLGQAHRNVDHTSCPRSRSISSILKAIVISSSTAQSSTSKVRGAEMTQRTPSGSNCKTHVGLHLTRQATLNQEAGSGSRSPTTETHL